MIGLSLLVVIAAAPGFAPIELQKLKIGTALFSCDTPGDKVTMLLVSYSEGQNFLSFMNRQSGTILRVPVTAASINQGEGDLNPGDVAMELVAGANKDGHRASAVLSKKSGEVAATFEMHGREAVSGTCKSIPVPPPPLQSDARK